MINASDEELVKLWKDEASSEKAFAFIVKKYQKPLYYHIRKIVLNHDDADDALQTTFINVWKNKDKFKGDSKLFTWIYRIATNEALMLLRSKAQRNSTSLHPIEHELSKSLESDVYFKGDAIQVKLQQAILTLPEKQRIVFNMRYYDEMPYEKISEVLETSVGALKASYHHAAHKVEAYLKLNV